MKIFTPSMLISLAFLFIVLSAIYYVFLLQPQKESKRLLQITKCEEEASSKAKDLLKTKVKMLGEISQNQADQLNEAVEHDLYLKDDFNEYYDRCLQKFDLK